MTDALDLALFGGFVLLSIVVILFRRFHHHETLVKPNEIGPTAWGLYSASQQAEPIAVNRQKPPRA
jgi:hypothetical protein